MADYEAVKDFYVESDLIDTYDAAVIQGAAAGAAGGMSRSDLKELGELLDEGQSGLIVVAASDMEAHVERAITRTTKMQKKQLRADEKELEAEIDQAAKL